MPSKNIEIASKKFECIKESIDKLINKNNKQWLVNYEEGKNEVEILIGVIDKKYKNHRNWLSEYIYKESA